MSVKLYSFDVFDTLITRTTASPRGIFSLMQQKLLKENSFENLPTRLRNNFFYLRIQGEAVARNTFIINDVKDITLYQIYQCIKETNDLSEIQAKQLMELEIQTEYENSIPIRENIENVKYLMEQGKKVILISNMYLPKRAIHQMLIKADSIFERITIYVSGELGKTKGTRTLYHYVKHKENIDFTEWEHFGDNRNLDVEIPLKLKMQAKWYESPGYLPWEQEFLNQKEDNVALQLLLGTSLYVRKEHMEDYSYQVGAGYAGPLLYPYVEWILQESIRKGICRLFFIARDGYILKKIADIIISCQKLDIKTFYLYGSRKAWRLPSITTENFDMEEFLMWNYPKQIYSYEGIAEIFEMSIKELNLFLPFELKENMILSGMVRNEVFKILKESQKEIASFIQEHQKEKREAIIGYLKQELGADDSSFAFVDLIGSGYTQKCLSELLDNVYSNKIKTFFYRLDSCHSYEKSKSYAYYPNRLKMGNIIEVLCGANHGQTVGYKKYKETWEPEWEEDEAQFLDAYGFQSYIKGVCSYTKSMALRWFWNENILLDLSVPGLYFDYMAKAKDKELYQYIADMPYGVRGSQKEVKSFAPALSNKTLRQMYLFCKDKPIRLFYSGYSLEFSLLRLSEKQKRMVERYKRYSETQIFKKFQKYFLKKHNRILNSKYDLIAKTIVLYGAGKRGQLLYGQLTSGKKYHAEIVLWVDKNFEECRKKGLNVCAPSSILNYKNYEQVVIAVVNEELAANMKNIMVSLGVPEYKILWISPQIYD